MQSQMQLKKAVKGAQAANNTISGNSSAGAINSSGLNLVSGKLKVGLPVLAPVIDLKSTKTVSGNAANMPDTFFANRRGPKRDKSVSVYQYYARVVPRGMKFLSQIT